MIRFIIFCSIFILVSANPNIADISLSVSANSNSHKAAELLVCKPGSIYHVKCNICHCSLDGKSSDCTKTDCVEWQEDGQFRCESGRIYKKDCNSCTCSIDGRTAACTSMACIAEGIVKKAENDKITINVELNKDNGKSEVQKTINHAIVNEINKAVDIVENIGIKPELQLNCIPNQIYDNNCKKCTCSADGQVLNCINSCTTSVVIDGGLICKPGETNNRGLQICTCNLDGLSENCSLKKNSVGVSEIKIIETQNQASIVAPQPSQKIIHDHNIYVQTVTETPVITHINGHGRGHGHGSGGIGIHVNANGGLLHNSKLHKINKNVKGIVTEVLDLGI